MILTGEACVNRSACKRLVEDEKRSKCFVRWELRELWLAGSALEGVYKTISRSHSRLFQLLIGGVRMESWTSAVRFQQEALPSSTVELRITVPPA